MSGHSKTSLNSANFLIRPPREERFRASSADSGLAFLTLDEMAKAARFFRALPAYSPTPLVQLTELARELGVAEVCVKDESTRLGLNSFKALGVSYAIARLLEEGSIRPENARAVRTLWFARARGIMGERWRISPARTVFLRAST